MNTPLEVYRAWILARVKAGEQERVKTAAALYRDAAKRLSQIERPTMDDTERMIARDAFADWLEYELQIALYRRGDGEAPEMLTHPSGMVTTIRPDPRY